MDNRIMELAAELGQAIKQDERVIAMTAAKEAFEGSKELQGKILEYNTQRAALGEEYKKDTVDEEFVEVINHRIDELYEAIVGDDLYKNYVETQETVNAFMNEVNGEITYQITGERPCTHDCSSCHAGCSHSHGDEEHSHEA